MDLPEVGPAGCWLVIILPRMTGISKGYTVWAAYSWEWL